MDERFAVGHTAEMSSLRNRVPLAADWLIALVAGVAVSSLNITSAGGPLSGAGLSAGPTSAGITEAGRVTFYGALVVAGAVLAAASVVLSALGPKLRAASSLGVRSFGGLALTGVAGLLLDYRDGPVSWVQLAVYVLLVLSVIRFARLSSMLASVSEDESMPSSVSEDESLRA